MQLFTPYALPASVLRIRSAPLLIQPVDDWMGALHDGRFILFIKEKVHIVKNIPHNFIDHHEKLLHINNRVALAKDVCGIRRLHMQEFNHTQKQQDIVFILNSIHNRHLKRKSALAAGKQELSDSSG